MRWCCVLVRTGYNSKVKDCEKTCQSTHCQKISPHHHGMASSASSASSSACSSTITSPSVACLRRQVEEVECIQAMWCEGTQKPNTHQQNQTSLSPFASDGEFEQTPSQVADTAALDEIIASCESQGKSVVDSALPVLAFTLHVKVSACANRPPSGFHSHRLSPITATTCNPGRRCWRQCWSYHHNCNTMPTSISLSKPLPHSQHCTVRGHTASVAKHYTS